MSQLTKRLLCLWYGHDQWTVVTPGGKKRSWPCARCGKDRRPYAR